MAELDKALRLTAGKNLGDIPLVREALFWVKGHPKGFEQRVDKFDYATADIAEAIILGGKRIKGKPGHRAFKKAYKDSGYCEPVRIHDLVRTYKHAKEEHWDGWEDDIRKLNQSVNAVGANLINGSLKFHPEVYAHPPTFLARLMVEGYAMELSSYFDQPKAGGIFKRAFGEVLSEKDYRRTLLADDVAYWTLLEDEDKSSLVTLSEFQAKKDGTKLEPLAKTAQEINSHFREGGNAGDIVDQLRKFPRPIAVDFNNVIANNDSPLQLNPDAPKFLEQLRAIGNIFIVTAADSWAHVQRFFVKHKIWTPDMVLMTYPTYMFLTEYGGRHPSAERLRTEFNEMAKMAFGKEFDDDQLVHVKRVAPLFHKPFNIPIIDDSRFSTDGNPGMLGIQVKTWEPGHDEPNDWHNKDLPSLAEAVEIVQNHYANIG